MKTLYYDCFAGISGDMNLAALIDLGVDTEKLAEELAKLPLDGWNIELARERRGGIEGVMAEVVLGNSGCHCGNRHHDHSHKDAHHHHHSNSDCGCAHDHSNAHESCCDGHGHAAEHRHEHRTFAQIRAMIEGSELSAFAKEKSVAIFRTLAEAEGKVHGKSPDEVHFHEVGAVDSIIDIVAAAVGAELLGAERFVSSAVELGGGTLRCEHGVMPVPAPATAEIAKAFPSKLGGASHECTTPTGAAIIATLCTSFEPKISGKIIATGIGVGHRQSDELPNVLRVMLIEEDGLAAEASLKSEKLFTLCANIDDMSAEALSFLTERLFSAGALDVWQEQIVMKKGRAAVKVCALAREDSIREVRRGFFMHSSTLGVRAAQVQRHSLERSVETLETPYGPVRFKVSEFEGSRRVKPEYEDLKRISEERGLPLSELESALLEAFHGRD